MTHRNNRRAKILMAELRATFGNQCDICATPLTFDERKQPNLQFAHIKPTGLHGKSRGRKERILDIRRNKTSYRLLCIDCHRAYDDLQSAQGINNHD